MCCNSVPAFLDATDRDREMLVMFDDKMGHCTHEMEVLGELGVRGLSRESPENESCFRSWPTLPFQGLPGQK